MLVVENGVEQIVNFLYSQQIRHLQFQSKNHVLATRLGCLGHFQFEIHVK